jgi:hypothetical protein
VILAWGFKYVKGVKGKGHFSQTPLYTRARKKISAKPFTPFTPFTKCEKQALSVTQVFTTGDPFFHQKSDLVTHFFTRKPDSPICFLSRKLSGPGTLTATPALENKDLPCEEADRQASEQGYRGGP